VGVVNDASKPGIRLIIDRVRGGGAAVAPERFVDDALELMGPVQLADVTRQSLIDFAAEEGELMFGSEQEAAKSEARIVRMLQLIVASREYQFA
jgi:hypothetical protein